MKLLLIFAVWMALAAPQLSRACDAEPITFVVPEITTQDCDKFLEKKGVPDLCKPKWSTAKAPLKIKCGPGTGLNSNGYIDLANKFGELQFSVTSKDGKIEKFSFQNDNNYSIFEAFAYFEKANAPSTVVITNVLPEKGASWKVYEDSGALKLATEAKRTYSCTWKAQPSVVSFGQNLSCKANEKDAESGICSGSGSCSDSGGATTAQADYNLTCMAKLNDAIYSCPSASECSADPLVVAIAESGVKPVADLTTATDTTNDGTAADTAPLIIEPDTAAAAGTVR